MLSGVSSGTCHCALPCCWEHARYGRTNQCCAMHSIVAEKCAAFNRARNRRGHKEGRTKRLPLAVNANPLRIRSGGGGS